MPARLPRRYYSKGATCCSDLRALLNCPPAPAPCREATADCLALTDQFDGMLFIEPETQCMATTSPVEGCTCAFVRAPARACGLAPLLMMR